MQLFSSWTGSDFVLFYIMLLGLSTLAARWIPVHLRATGRCSESPDAEDIAMLAGGRSSHADSVIADLFVRGGLSNFGDLRLHVTESGLPASQAGRALLAKQEPFSRREADDILAIHAKRILARLRREGLMLRPEELTRLRWLSILPFAALFVIGLYRQRAGSALGESTEFMMILLGLTVALALIRFVKFDQRTIAGIKVVRHLRAKSSRLRRAPQSGEAALAVALFGTGVLVGTPWEPVHAMRQQGNSDGSGSGDSGDSGGGDGGGCGGCEG